MERDSKLVKYFYDKAAPEFPVGTPDELLKYNTEKYKEKEKAKEEKGKGKGKGKGK